MGAVAVARIATRGGILVSEASARLERKADEIRAIAQEHGADRDYDLVELILRLVARALDDIAEEREAA